MGGDFNLTRINWEKFLPETNIDTKSFDILSNAVSQFSMEQLVLQPTRGENILNLSIINSSKQLSNIRIEQGLSDHKIVLSELNNNFRHISSNPYLSYQYHTADRSGFKQFAMEQLSEILICPSRTVQKYWQCFQNLINESIKNISPEKLKTVNQCGTLQKLEERYVSSVN